jgi:hypothetical protein
VVGGQLGKYTYHALKLCKSKCANGLQSCHHMCMRRVDTVFHKITTIKSEAMHPPCIVFTNNNCMPPLSHFVFANTIIDQAIDEFSPLSGRHEIKEDACIWATHIVDLTGTEIMPSGADQQFHWPDCTSDQHHPAPR